MSMAVKLPDLLEKGMPSLTNLLRYQRSESKNTAFIHEQSAVFSRVKLNNSTDFAKGVLRNDRSPSSKTSKFKKNHVSQIMIDTSIKETPFSLQT